MVRQRIPYEEQMVHIRFEGQSWSIPCATLDVGSRSSDQEVRWALAHYLEIPVRKLAHYVVERHTNGNITVRPEAVFG